MAALQAVAAGSGLGAHREWVGLKASSDTKVTSRSSVQKCCSKKNAVQMALSVEKKQFVTKKSEETFTAAKVRFGVSQFEWWE